MVTARLVAFLACALFAVGAPFGRVVPLFGGASDLVLDEGRGRIYLPSSSQNLIQIYSIQQQNMLTAIPTDQMPLSAALSRDGKFLYVTCYTGSVLDVIDLGALNVVQRLNLPAKPEGVAVARDGRVLISTSGNGTNAASNVLLLYDPTNAAAVLSAISVTPPAPTPPRLPPPSGRPFLSTTSQLRATRDGSYIIGVNVPSAGSPTVFVFEAASGTVLRSRAVVGSSNVLSVSDDGTRFLCGPNLFETATLKVLAQLNLANAPYPVTPTANFNLQSNQGGSVFSPDGQTLYAAFDISPVQNPPAPVNASQLMMNDPDNLLIRMGFQLPENLAGKMVITADGSSGYALSDSGFINLPFGTIPQSPLAAASTDVVFLTSDPCTVTTQSTASVTINNAGRGRVTANAQLLQYVGQPNQASPATAPSVRTTQTAGGPQFTFSFNPAVSNGFGTVTPPHDFLIQSPEAINIPDRIRVYENRHDSEAPGTVIPIPVGISATAALQDIVYDSARQRVYIANAGLNRVEVYDIAQQMLLAPVKVGQLPNSLALTPDGSTLYVANSGGESISIVDPNKLQVTGAVAFPPIPFNSNLALVTPRVIAAGLSGLQILMGNGTLWEVLGTTAVPRKVSTVIGQTAAGLPAAIPVPSSMAATPGGEYILLATNTGFAYIYDATADDFVAGRQVFAAAQTGYVGPVAAGPAGQYYVMNGTLLNQALTPQAAGGAAPGLVSAVATNGTRSYAVFSPPAGSTSATALPTTQATVRMVDTISGASTIQVNAVEGPLTPVAGTARATINGRMMALDAAGSTAYVITASGLSIISLAPVSAAARPQPFRNGAVNLASYQLPVAANGWISIFGTNLAADDISGSVPLPAVLGGSCVTLNNIALPLYFTTSTQINAQIPPNLAPGTYPLVVHSIASHVASASQGLTVSRYAPAVLVDSTGQVALYHQDGSYVNQDNPANRDEPLTLYAVGLGPTTGGAVTTGMPAPLNPLAITGTVEVFFGRTDFKQSAVIVEWSGLVPGIVGIYQLNVRIPGFHIKGNDLVTVKVGGVSSPSTGPAVPYVPVN